MKAVQKDLIFDVGADTGDDTAYYLFKGYRVVAVEPNPLSAAGLRERFSKEIAAGRLILLELAIATTEGTADFWICDDLPAWSSLDRQMASKNRSRHHSVSVPTCPFGDLLERFGVPFYCKIDIEGADKTCLDDMSPGTKPPFVSVEMAYEYPHLALAPTRALLDRFSSLGYKRFKVISQVTHRQPSNWFLQFKAMLPWRVSLRVTKLQGMFHRYRPDANWAFDGHVSGPFAEETHGGWLTYQEAGRMIEAIGRNHEASEWFDIHAAE